jgi:hypothetical protein
MLRDRRADQARLAAEHGLQILQACIDKPPSVAYSQFHHARFGRRQFFGEIPMLRDQEIRTSIVNGRILEERSMTLDEQPIKEIEVPVEMRPAKGTRKEPRESGTARLTRKKRTDRSRRRSSRRL